MAEPAVAATGGGNAAQPAQQQAGGGGGFWGAITRSILIYFVISSLMRYMNGPPPTGSNIVATGGEGGALPSSGPLATTGGGGVQGNLEQKQIQHRNMWRTGERMYLSIYLSESSDFWNGEAKQVRVMYEPLIYVAEINEIAKNMSVEIDQFPRLFANESNVFVHVFLARNSATPADLKTNAGNPDITHIVKPMTALYLESKSKLKKNLISGQAADADAQNDTGNALAKAEPVLQRRTLRHWVPDLTLKLVHDHTVFPKGTIPPHMMKFMKFDKNDNYFPILYFHDFWVVKDRTLIVNDTISSLPLRVSISSMSLFYWQLFAAVEQNFEMHETMGTMDEGGKDDFKKILLEGNPVLLGITMVVSLLHTVFDLLAFKNDISFWKNVDSLEGLSVRSIFLSVFCQGVVFLYLLDNETSYMILFSSGMGLAIEVWKIKKACDITIDRSGVIPKISFKDRSTYVSKTRIYDQMAMRYLGYVLYPLVLGYSIYSVVHGSHKSWYSWVLSTLVGCVYTFGFIMMTPQLFINYKLKSVAHLPWKAMTYKFLNTIIDDLFAFVITMPLMHRLSCFRDDIIFLIYVYQRWIYRVDMTRVNEYGQVGDREAFEKLRSEQQQQPQQVENSDSKKSE